MKRLAGWLGGRIAHYLNQPTRAPYPHWPADLDTLRRILRPADVVLVEGRARISTAIKYLTQSTWSHVALYVGDLAGERAPEGAHDLLIEADTELGVHLLPLAELGNYHVRICRPVGLSAQDTQRVVDYALGKLGQRYDLRNVFDLARYLLPLPVPTRWRRRALAFGAGDPTRAICSTLIAEAFQSIPYPILPIVKLEPAATPQCADCVSEIYRIRDHRLYTPRDFDVSPYFEVIKPTIARGFDYHALRWEPVAPE